MGRTLPRISLARHGKNVATDVIGTHMGRTLPRISLARHGKNIATDAIGTHMGRTLPRISLARHGKNIATDAIGTHMGRTLPRISFETIGTREEHRKIQISAEMTDAVLAQEEHSNPQTSPSQFRVPNALTTRPPPPPCFPNFCEFVA